MNDEGRLKMTYRKGTDHKREPRKKTDLKMADLSWAARIHDTFK